VFLDASPEARSQRRYEQNASSANQGHAQADQASVLQALRERDERDRNRANSPLHPAPDAIVIDSTSLSLEQVLARIEEIVRPLLAQR
jgi:cytidylate kinase